MTRTAGVSLVIAALAACGGASGEDVQAARSAQYACSFEQVYEAASVAMEEVFYRVAAADPANGVLRSEPRWYEETGTPRQRGAADVDEEDVYVLAEARVIKNGSTYAIATAADVVEHMPGSPRGRRLTADDPARPTWVQGKLDRVASIVHERLAACARSVARRQDASVPDDGSEDEVGMRPASGDNDPSCAVHSCSFRFSSRAPATTTMAALQTTATVGPAAGESTPARSIRWSTFAAASR
jgi:hypothetical protein